MTETLIEASSYDERRESWAAQGFCNLCAARLAYDGIDTPCTSCQKIVTDDGRDILKFLTSWTDHALAKDLDSALAACVTDADRKVCRGYLALRKAAPGWKPKRIPAKNNHKAVKASDVDELIVKAEQDGTRACGWCGERFPAFGRRRYCGDACKLARKNLARTA